MLTDLILSITTLRRCVVWTGDEKVFFYNPSLKTSVWERPMELKNRTDVDKLLKGPQFAQEVAAENETAKQNTEKRSLNAEENGTPKKQK